MIDALITVGASTFGVCVALVIIKVLQKLGLW